MTTRLYPKLTSQGRIGGLELRNRFVVTAMGVGLGEDDGQWGDRITAYHEEQARGGVGLIVSGVAGVAWPIGAAHENQVGLSEDRFVPGLKTVVDAVHAHGAKFAVQLHHGGPNAHAARARGIEALAPSIPISATRSGPDTMFPHEKTTSTHSRAAGIGFKQMGQSDVDRVVAQFAAAAARAVEAGVDGIEIHGGHGYMISSFLSPRKNRRADCYGGPLENRAKLLLDIIRAIRAVVGPNFPLWCKLDARELGPAPGITIEDAIKTAQLAERAGVNAITVTSVSHPEAVRGNANAHTPHTPAVNLPSAAQIKKGVSVPIIASGRVDLDVAEAAIAKGELDFLSMGRKILADPELPNKVAAGHSQDVRPCVYCYTCISNIPIGQPVRCAVNPRLGFEFLPLAEPRESRRVVVVGGGPAGMEAARRLDLDGHDVVLMEQLDRLGGTLRFASLAYPENGLLLEWLQGRLKASKVDVKVGVRVDVELLHKLKPDAILIATGATRRKPPIPGAHLPHVFGGDDLKALILGGNKGLKDKVGWGTRVVTTLGAATGLSDNVTFIREATRHWMPFGKHVTIIGGDLVGLELAEFLTDRDRVVTVIDEAPQFGAGLQYVRRSQMIEDLGLHHVELAAGASGIQIQKDAVTFVDQSGSKQSRRADHVILAKGATGDLTLAYELQSQGFDVHTAGDCRGVGYIEGAIRGAAEAATAISGGVLAHMPKESRR